MIDTSKTLASTAVSSSFNPPDTRRAPNSDESLTKFSLKPIDIVVLKKLSDVVNVVPVIAKSDSLTLAERQAFKHRVCSIIIPVNMKIKAEFAFHNIKMYPYDNDEFDEEERALNAQIKVAPSTSCRHEPCLQVEQNPLRGRGI